jgi:poly(A) polymerase
MSDITSITVPGAQAPWTEALAVAATLTQHGFEAWCVGGCVRDLLLGRAVQDVDIASDAVPEAIERLFPRTVAVGKSFGVMVVVAPSGAQVEVATFRHDGRYLDGRHPEQVRFGTAIEDVARRDFTINALLLDPLSGRVVDHVGGLADLQARRLRCVGEPRQRLAEDRLRVLRALRFAAVLDFAIEPQTAAALAETALAGLSAERVMQEWFKALASGRAAAWLALAARYGRLSEVTPPLARCDEAGLEATAQALARLPAAAPLAVRAAAWLSQAPGSEAITWLGTQPLERALVREVSWLLQRLLELPGWPALAIAPRRRWAREPLARALAQLAGAALPGAPATAAFAAQVALEAATPHQPHVAASDLLALGLAPGPALGALLRRLEDAQLAGLFSDRGAALGQARAWVQEQRGGSGAR